ncbi:MAG: TonB-dependent receptor [Sphingomonas sp.]|uniref:TonB-dependent receptor n=1 Tax=Sphingomonas sp. TaxID=28214 RepID=UPI001B20B632|nr:TonB-dependent receptor [Sphingomonas sp.]MBO9624315.1 TonB-dependent receptor [Sphingomonas sp.]
MRSHLARGISAAALAAALVIGVPAVAQTTATLQGHVEGVQPGATVTVTDTVTGRSVTVPVKEDGRFVIPGLRPSTYRVEVPGQEPRDVTLPVGQTITVDLGEAPEVAAAEGAEIVVTGTRDRTEVRTATVSTNVSQTQIENLPQNDRNFLNFAALAPGVSVSPTAGTRRIQAGAVSADNTNVFIDGLSLKNPINHGGVAGQNFSRGNPFPQSAVQEFKVDTQNFKAEYEQAGSAIITAVTKSGGTEFHGGAFGEWQPRSFISRPYFDRPGQANNPDGTRPKGDYERWQYGADLGGPIIKDKLHFFAAFEGTSQTLPSASVALKPEDGVPAAIINEFNGTYPQTFEQRLYFGKLSLFATERDTINGSVFIRQEDELRDFGGNAVPSHGHQIDASVKVYQLEWNHRGDDWLNELTVAYNTVTNGTPRVSEGPEIVLNRLVAFGGEAAFLGANSFEQNDRQETWTFKNNVTFYGGDHTVKAGAKVSLNDYSREEDLRSNGSYFFHAPLFTTFDASTPFGASITTVDVRPARAKNTQIGLFVQDDWTPDDHWTINAGLRWDFETNAKNENFVTPDNVATALRNYPGWKAAGIDPEDYISTGDNRKPFWGAFQPRLGISYDVHGDRDLIFFAGAGRYYDRPLFITAGIETIKNLYQSSPQISFCDGGGGQPTCASVSENGVLPIGYIPYSPTLKDPEALRAAVSGIGGDIWLLNNDTKLPYSDQFSVGVRKRFGAVQTSLTFSHIRSHNIFQFVRGNRFSNGWYTRILQRDAAGNVIGCTDGGTNWVQDNIPDADFAACPATQGDLAGFNGKLNIGQNNGKAVYNAVYLTIDKPYSKESGWGLTLSGTYQRARTNVGTELGSDEFFAGTEVDQFGWQYVQGVDQYRFVATGMVDLPLGILLSATGTFASGPAYGYAGCPPAAIPNPGPAPENTGCIANLGGVRFPPNEFAYANVDLRLTKTFELPWGHQLQIKGEVFNLFDSINRNYSSWSAGNNPPRWEEEATVGNARTFQVGASYRF